MPAHRKDFVYRIIAAAGRKDREALRDVIVIGIVPEFLPAHGSRPDFQCCPERRIDNVDVRRISTENKCLFDVPCLCVGRYDHDGRDRQCDDNRYRCLQYFFHDNSPASFIFFLSTFLLDMNIFLFNLDTFLLNLSTFRFNPGTFRFSSPPAQPLNPLRL